MERLKMLTLALAFAAIFSGCGNEKSNQGTKDDTSAMQEDIVSDQQLEGVDKASGVLKNTAGQATAIQPEAMMQAALNGNVNVIRDAIEKGYDVDATDAGQHTVLMMAAYNGHTEIISLLLDHGAGTDARDNQQRTALMYASTGPFNETVELLLEAGADPNLVDNDEHFTAIMFAAAEGQKEVVSTLLKYGADKTMQDEDGESAYDFAIANGHSEIAAMLK
ncbi:MAG: ankyrin repeat domain-containing protein [Bacteroidales bacterium]|nr:ankyrin repeat domain-containing protein [Bacteroidales bacterium]MDT8432209.1 ankyrin repeat domain-containing protein [Bacteroidales bacterium]